MSSEDSNYFFVILPSNVSDYPENRPNHYRVHLPKSIKFQGGNWFCGLYSISYTHSWSSTLGTFEEQWIDFFTADNGKWRISIPKTSQNTTEGLTDFLNNIIERRLNETKIRKKRQIDPAKREEVEFVGNFFSLHPG